MATADELQTALERLQDRIATERQRAHDVKVARDVGLFIVGYPRTCRCGGRAYHSPKPGWQNRVICLMCKRKWSE